MWVFHGAGSGSGVPLEMDGSLVHLSTGLMGVQGHFVKGTLLTLVTYPGAESPGGSWVQWDPEGGAGRRSHWPLEVTGSHSNVDTEL